MEEIVLEPDLSECIETKAKKEYDRILSRLLKGEEGMEEELEALRIFLSSADFPRLRAEYEKYLVEGKRVLFFIGRNGEYRMEVR